MEVKELKDMLDEITPALMHATANEERKRNWAVAMNMTRKEQTTLIRFLNQVGDYLGRTP